MSVPSTTAPAKLAFVPDVPNVDGSKQDGKHLAFGAPTSAIGPLRSVSSTLRAPMADQLGKELPPPVPAAWTAPVGGLVGFGAGAFFGAMGSMLVWGFALRPLLRAIKLWGAFFSTVQLGTTALLALLVGAVAAYFGVKLGRKLAPRFATQERSMISGEWTLFVGQEGLAKARHNGTKVTLDEVRFADAPYATFGMTRTTYRKQSGAVTGTSESQAFELFDAQGRSRMKLEGTKYDDDILRSHWVSHRGAAAADRAFIDCVGPRVLAASMTAEGATFPFPRPGASFLRVTPGKLEFSRGSSCTELPLAELTKVALDAGSLVIRSRSSAEIRVPFGDLCNGKLLLIALQAQGVTIG